MNDLVYTPDDDVKVHEEGAIHLICAYFKSHETGLPEWLKNSADAYARENAPEERRAIVVLVNQGRKDQPASLSCLDFSGMTSTAIEDNFRHWADPEAARAGSSSNEIQGGHGNGGKCYMTQMFDKYSSIYSVKAGKGNHYGVTAGSIKFGYIPDRDDGKDFDVPDLNAELERALQGTGCSLGTVWKVARHALRKCDGFTLVKGVGPKGYQKKFPTKSVISNLQDHPQMMMTLEMCKVYVIVNGKPFKRGEPLTLPKIKPFKGEEPLTTKIPEILVDDQTGEEVSTTGDGVLPEGTLTLCTSHRSMRYSKKGRHNIIYKAKSGFIGYDPIQRFDVISSFSNYIYGHCELMALEGYKQNARTALADSPLTRALYRFVSEKIQEYAELFEERDKKRYDHEEKNAISEMNEALDQWKNHFLSEIMSGMWGRGGPGPEPPRPQPLPSGKPSRMELALRYDKAGIGISLKPSIKFFDIDGKKIRPVPYRWVSEDNNVAMIDEDLMVINTLSYGETKVYAETLDGTIRSNSVPMEVVRILQIDIVPSEIELNTGRRYKLDAVCRLADGSESAGVYLDWISVNDDIAGVNASGTVFGISPGEAEIMAADEICDSNNPAKVTVVQGVGRGGGDKKGKGYPRVLVSAIDKDPDTGDFRDLTKHDPPVYQNAMDVDRNIWWINSEAPLARLYLDKYGFKSREWRMYHLERYIEVICQIALTNGPDEFEQLSANDWVYHWGDQVAQIQLAAADELADFIEKGILPV